MRTSWRWLFCLGLGLGACAPPNDLSVVSSEAAAAKQMAGHVKAKLSLGAEHELRLRHQSPNLLTGEQQFRFEQLYRGLPVFDAEASTSRAADGTIGNTYDSFERDINVSTTPTLDENAARAIAEQTMPALSSVDQAELGIFAERQQVVKATGLPPAKDDRKTNAEDLEERLVAHHLAWRLDLSPPQEVDAPRMQITIDAQTGVVLSTTKLTNYYHSTTGKSQYSGTVPLRVDEANASCNRRYLLRDPSRGNNVVVDWTNHQIVGTDNDTWGDGNDPTQGYFSGVPCDPSKQTRNYQTAGVDVMYGFEVAWDMYKNAFGLNGNHGDGTGVAGYIHMLGGSSAYQGDGFSIWFSDGDTLDTPHVAPDTVIHEYTHSVDDKFGPHDQDTAEAIADIFAVLGKLYSTGGGSYDTTATQIPASTSTSDFALRTQYTDTSKKGIYLYQPTKGDPNGYDMYSPASQADPDEHRRAEPFGRMFYYLSQGASAHVDSNTKDSYRSYTSFLPWGSTGYGADTAGRLAFTTFFNGCMKRGAADNYSKARSCALDLVSSSSQGPLRNAFAGINVGTRDPNYPADPPLQYINLDQSVKALAFTAPTAGYEDVYKAWVSGWSAGTYDNWFSVHVMCGRKLGMRLTPQLAGAADLDIDLVGPYGHIVKSATASGSMTEEQLWWNPDALSPACDPSTAITYFIRVHAKAGSSSDLQTYDLHVDTYY